jgi:hypothetical protein
MGEKETPGMFRDGVLEAEMSKAIRSGNAAAICNAYVDSAQRVADTYRNLTSDEKRAQLDALKHKIEMAKVLTKQDCSDVLRKVAQIFGITSGN